MALAPPGLATVTSTAPVAPGGEVAVIEEALFTVNGAATDPKLTEVTRMKLAPVMVTTVPPEVGPALGLTPLTLGAGGSE